MLDLVRLTDDRWIARAVATRHDGTTVVLEEVLRSRAMPSVEAAVTEHDDAPDLVLRDRHDPSKVIARVSLRVPRPALRLVAGGAAAETRSQPALTRGGPPGPA